MFSQPPLTLALPLAALYLFHGVIMAFGEDAKTDAPCPVAVAFEYYDISAASSSEIKEELLARGPRDSYGVPRFAFTDWRVKWDWKLGHDGRVLMDSVAVKCAAKIVLPRLVKRETSAADLAARWDRFISATMAHEAQHVEHVERHANQIVSRIKQLPLPLRDRGQIGNNQETIALIDAQRIVREVVSEIKELDRAYDLKTQHGRSEGGWWGDYE